MVANDYFTKRLHYYNGQFLLVDDFSDQQRYHENRQELHGRLSRVWGIAEGLGVTITPTDAKAVDVAPGAAVDATGRLILLVGTTKIDMPSGIAAGDHALVIAFAETPTDPAAAKYVPGNTRLTQSPSIAVKPFATTSPGEIVVATLTVDAAANVTQVDTGTRTYAGLRLTGASDGGFALRPMDDETLVISQFPAGDASFTPLVTISKTGHVGIGASGSLTLAGLTGVLKGNGASAISAMTGTTNKVTRWLDANTLGVGAIFDDGASVGIGTSSPGATLEVAGTISSTSGGFKFPDGTIQTGAVPAGVIVMWHGDASSIPTGWALCDGTNGTPDLRSRFIVGAGPGSNPAYTPGTSGGPDSHTHNVSVQVSGQTDVAGHHWHGNFGILAGGGGTMVMEDEYAGAHSHSISINSQSSSTSTYSGENRPRWYALCFIMKL